VPSWTRNAVSVAEPSVWNQLMSPGTFLNRKYLTPPTIPDRTSSQLSGIITIWPTVAKIPRLRCRLGGGTTATSR